MLPMRPKAVVEIHGDSEDGLSGSRCAFSDLDVFRDRRLTLHDTANSERTHTSRAAVYDCHQIVKSLCIFVTINSDFSRIDS